jgi:hypothetical protein
MPSPGARCRPDTCVLALRGTESSLLPSNEAVSMTQDNELLSELQAKLAQYRRLLDPLLDNMSLDSIRALVSEIEDRIAAHDSE